MTSKLSARKSGDISFPGMEQTGQLHALSNKIKDNCI